MASAHDLSRAARLGLIGDVHAEDALLERAFALFAARGAEALLCVGDIVDGPGDAERTCALLQQHGVLAVRGNHDRWLGRNTMRDLPDATPINALSSSSRGYLASLPVTRALDTPLGKAMLCHGLGSSDMSGVAPDDAGYALESNLDLQELIDDPDLVLVFNGHTHRAMVRRFGGLTIVNAGTLFREHQPGVAIVDFDALAVTWVSLANGGQAETLLGRL
jgi:predicted phosphodiesterase